MTLYQGDCLWMMNAIPAGSVDLVLCDLPYGTTQNKWDIIIDFEQLWEHYRRVCKGAIVLTAQCPFDKVLGASNLEMLKYEWIWKKNSSTGFMNANKMPLKIHENILVFYNKLPVYNPQFSLGESYTKLKGGYNPSLGNNYGVARVRTDIVNEGKRFPNSIVEFKRIERPLHPTQKPVALMEYLIRTYTNPGGTVLDNCMGSGTTGVACVNTDRKFIGIERDPGYFKIASDRISYAEALRAAEQLA